MCGACVSFEFLYDDLPNLGGIQVSYQIRVKRQTQHEINYYKVIPMFLDSFSCIDE